jgi:RNA polymerase sigma-70 factor (ECF subfamily)
MDGAMSGHSTDMRTPALLAPPDESRAGTAADRGEASALPSVSEVYQEHFEFVWRSTRRLGVEPSHIDDVVQEVFVLVHRKLPSFEGRSGLRTWLFGITRRVVAAHRRARRRRQRHEQNALEIAVGSEPANVEAEFARLEGTRLLHALLDQLDDDKREVFVLAELEEMSAPEIASALDITPSCVYARVRAARQDFELALRRLRARQRGTP